MEVRSPAYHDLADTSAASTERGLPLAGDSTYHTNGPLSIEDVSKINHVTSGLAGITAAAISPTDKKKQEEISAQASFGQITNDIDATPRQSDNDKSGKRAFDSDHSGEKVDSGNPSKKARLDQDSGHGNARLDPVTLGRSQPTDQDLKDRDRPQPSDAPSPEVHSPQDDRAASSRPREGLAADSSPLQDPNETSDPSSSGTEDAEASEPNHIYVDEHGNRFDLLNPDDFKRFSRLITENKFTEALEIVLEESKRSRGKLNTSEQEQQDAHGSNKCRMLRLEAEAFDDVCPDWSKNLAVDMMAIYRSLMQILGVDKDFPLLPGTDHSTQSFERLLSLMHRLCAPYINRYATGPEWIKGPAATAANYSYGMLMESYKAEVSADQSDPEEGQCVFLCSTNVKVVLKLRKQFGLDLAPNASRIDTRELTTLGGKGPLKFTDDKKHLREEYMPVVNARQPYSEQDRQELGECLRLEGSHNLAPHSSVHWTKKTYHESNIPWRKVKDELNIPSQLYMHKKLAEEDRAAFDRREEKIRQNIEREDGRRQRQARNRFGARHPRARQADTFNAQFEDYAPDLQDLAAERQRHRNHPLGGREYDDGSDGRGLRERDASGPRGRGTGAANQRDARGPPPGAPRRPANNGGRRGGRRDDRDERDNRGDRRRDDLDRGHGRGGGDGRQNGRGRQGNFS